MLNKSCPMSFSGEVEHACIERECAWWDSLHGVCIIKTICASLYDIKVILNTEDEKTTRDIK